MFPPYMLMFCRATIAFLFIFSFGRKALTFRDFVVTIADFKLLPRRWSRSIALLFLCGEIATALAVTVGGVLLPIGFGLAIVLLVTFSVALLQALRRHIRMSCNCFGRTERPISYYDVVRNLLLILCSLLGLWMQMYAQQGLSNGEIVLLLLMSISLLMFATNLSDVIKTLLRPFPVSEERR